MVYVLRCAMRKENRGRGAIRNVILDLGRGGGRLNGLLLIFIFVEDRFHVSLQPLIFRSLAIVINVASYLTDIIYTREPVSLSVCVVFQAPVQRRTRIFVCT